MPIEDDSPALVEPVPTPRFDDRFDGFRLTAVQDIFWPVFVHTFNFSWRKDTSLNAIEEALLRLVAAGVSSVDDLRKFLGIGKSYFERIVDSLCGASAAMGASLQPPLNGLIQPGTEITSTLNTLRKVVVQDSAAEFVRDALFDLPIDYCSSRFRITRRTAGNAGGSWLGPLAVPTLTDVSGIVGEILRTSLASSLEILRYELEQDGELAWIPLALACYESAPGRSGRFLLFDPHDDDRPIDDLSLMFEGLLETRIPPLYYPPDRLSTASQFWSGIASQSRTTRLEEELSERKISFEQVPTLAVTRKESNYAGDLGDYLADYAVHASADRVDDAGRSYQKAIERFLEMLCEKGELTPDGRSIGRRVRQFLKNSTASLEQQDAVRSLLHAVSECPKDLDSLASAHSRLMDLVQQFGFDAVLSHLDLDAAHRRIEAEQRSKENLAHIKELESRLSAVPKIHHIRTEDHQEWLRRALTEATHTIVIVSPWIKTRVLRPLLPMLAAAVRRGCRIWIGHGMPPNAFHQDRSDPDALRSLDAMGESVVRADDLGTHEKVLICDDQFVIVTSYNWLSFDGRNRRERGIVQLGGDVSVQGYEYIKVISDRRTRQRPPGDGDLSEEVWSEMNAEHGADDKPRSGEKPSFSTLKRPPQPSWKAENRTVKPKRYISDWPADKQQSSQTQTNGLTTADDEDWAGAAAEIVERHEHAAHQVRINELARKLNVRALDILKLLPEFGVIEKKGYSSSIDIVTAERIRARLQKPAPPAAAPL